MMQETPEWLNEKFLSTSLQGGMHNSKNIKVKSYTAAPAVPAGNNYGSCLLRVKLKYEEEGKGEVQPLSLIVKSPLTDTFTADIFECLQGAETIFYNKFLLHASKITKPCFAPKNFFSPISSVIVLEDLTEKGFVMADRCKLLDFEHCRYYATAAATLHATSVAVAEEDLNLIESMGAEKFFSNELPVSDLFKTAIKDGLQCMSEQMENSDFKRYSEPMLKAASSLWDKVCAAHKPSNVFNCLNQGDPWTTNMMFKYDRSGKITDIKLLDFQALRYGSPVNDLVMFLWTSADHDIRENRLDDFLHVYCDALNSKLYELGSTKTFTYGNVLEALEALRPASLMFAAAVAPLLVQPGEIDFVAILSTEKIDCNGKPLNKLVEYYNKDYCANHIPRILKQLSIMGVFNCLDNL